ncbi:hypothetical protein QFC21_000718 [Naganishia friedmannii]|uniref:Uncharacterized protein n=1 Tax=Naganishia friedmannii TaxID=89922 RepID=A0ACC2W766_9TREE|nr:hypothetical protein QFC21_000718 [Naganishia friedmannii]
MFRRLPSLSRRNVAFASSAVLATTGAYYLLNSSTAHADGSQIPVSRRRPGPLWSPPTREQMLKHLKSSGKTLKNAPVSGNKNEPPASAKVTPTALTASHPEDEDIFDLLVVGGGATGSGVALDAASRGLKVACVEREDFSSGTSSKSTKLVHGGVRYLQKAVFELDYEQWKLVKEALRERKIFLETAPHLSHSLPLLLPIYTWWQLPYYYAGCKLYDFLAGSQNMETAYWMGRGKALEAFPMLKSEGLVGGVVYYDGQHNDSRMNVSLIMTAVQYGAVVTNYTEVVKVNKAPSSAHGGKERITGVRLKDRMTGEEWDVKCKGLINATGPFTDGLRKLDNQEVAEIVAPSSGVHITLPNYYGPKSMGLLDPNTSDGRVIFFLPWQGNVIAGTTDSPSAVEQHPLPKEEEIQWILDEVRRYLSPDIKVRRGDVLAAWSGLRPLVRDPDAADTQSLVRNHMINTSESGLMTIAGGKWTTYRAMAEETVDEAIKEFKLKPAGPCTTHRIKLIGAHAWSPTMFIKLIQQFGLETEVAKHLSNTYGDRSWTVAAMADETGQSWPIHGIRLNPLYPYIEAEARYACRAEYALKATDFIARRTRLSFLNVQATLDSLPRVIEIMGNELGWDSARRDTEFDEALVFLESMGLPSHLKGLKLQDVKKKSLLAVTGQGVGPMDETNLYNRAQFSPDEVKSLQKSFEQLDFDHDGQITKVDLMHAMRDMGYADDEEVATSILREVDMGRKGHVQLHDFLEIAAGMKELQLENAFTHLAHIGDIGHSVSNGDPAGPRAKEYSAQRADVKAISVERTGGGA